MKKLSFFNKIIYTINTIVAFALLIAYLLPFIPPKQFATLSVLSLGVPLLVILNILFCVYWLFTKSKKRLLLSLIILVLGYSYINKLFKFSFSEVETQPKNFSVISYNVRLFNFFDWLPNTSVKDDILEFIKNENPDILCIQEYHQEQPIKLKGYQKFELLSNGRIKSGLAIFSKFPILNTGAIDFKNSSNSAIYADVLKDNDTIRVYNLHLQSSRINPNVNVLEKENSNHLFNQIKSTFKAQQTQAEKIVKHKAQSKYKTIVTGDFNNTAYSYVYNEIKGNMTDCFEQSGSGFGKTFDFKFYPLRIDFILTDPDFTVNDFVTYSKELSDHYPVKATLNLD